MSRCHLLGQYGGERPQEPVCVIQYLDGKPGDSINFNDDRRLSFAAEFARAIAKLQSRTYQYNGRIQDVVGDCDDVSIIQFFVEPYGGTPGDPQLKADLFSTRELLENLIVRHRVQERKAHYTIYVLSELFDIVMQMDELGMFKDDVNVLCHRDLEARNVLVHELDGSSVKLASVLDWDEAVIAPLWVGCRIPRCLRRPGVRHAEDMEAEEREQLVTSWNGFDEEGYDRSSTDYLDPHVKSVIEEIIGPQRHRYLFRPEYEMARRLFNIALHGTRSDDEYKQGKSLAAAWEKLYTELQTSDCYS